MMQKNVGIVRNNLDLEITKNQLNLWKNTIDSLKLNHKVTKEIYELENMIDVSLLVVSHSLKRTENKGGFIKN